MKQALMKLTEEDFEDMKNQVQDDLQKIILMEENFAEENFDGMKRLNQIKGEIGDMKKIAEENLEKMKNDFERQKKEMKTHLEDMMNQMKGDLKKSNEEVLKKSNEEVLKGMKTSLKDGLHHRWCNLCFLYHQPRKLNTSVSSKRAILKI